MTEPDARLTELFRDETAKRLDQMDTALLAVEAGQAGAESVDGLLRHAHTIKGAAGMLGFDNVRELAAAAEEVLAQARAAGQLQPATVPPLLRATATLRSQLTGPGASAADAGLIAELELCRAGLAGDDSDRPAGAGPATDTAAAHSPPATSGTVATGSAAPALRVPAAKIDHLLDIAGEITQNQRQLVHVLRADRPPSQEVSDVLGAGDRMLDELQDIAVGMRTLPLASIASQLPRAVRDVAHAEGKDVEFALAGAETELDRVIIESLSEPLVHLLRNAVVHGVEPPAERERAGKPPRARIELRAEPRGAQVQITVSDDGRGITEEIAREAGNAGSLADLLARPGYSTAGAVTDLAGRGVGLDAVRMYAQSMGGTFELRSEPGRGMDVILTLPLALALAQVLLVVRGADVYGVPLAAITEVVTVAGTVTLQGAQSLEFRGEALPVHDLARLIGADAAPLPARPPALVISVGGRQAIASCDELLGQAEVMIKPLGSLLAGVPGYLGAAILGDGRVALLIEPTVLTREPQRLAKSAAAVPGADQATAPKILVVEDSFTVRELQRGILEAAGYPVTTARNGVEALRCLDLDAEIALVITDLEMPEKDGIELTRAIRSQHERASLPVVVVTALGSQDDRRRGLEAGADAYMAKRSFDQQALLATVERLVGQ